MRISLWSNGKDSLVNTGLGSFPGPEDPYATWGSLSMPACAHAPWQETSLPWGTQCLQIEAQNNGKAKQPKLKISKSQIQKQKQMRTHYSLLMDVLVHHGK